MSTVNTAVVKQPFKLIEIPLNKFRDEAVPHHKTVLEVHKNTVQKLISSKQTDLLGREIKDKKRIIRQLKDLMYELDTLRTQVEDSDLAKFDSQTLSLRKTILELISNYTSLESEATKFIQDHIQVTSNDKNLSPTQESPQLQLQEDLSELKCNENEKKLQQIEALNKDIEDVHGIFVDLNQMTGQQADSVNSTAASIEVAHENVRGGLRQLIQASRLKKASYPVAGAFVGTVIGGPIGSLAGLKIGGLAAIGCGLIGYISGKFMKNVNENEISKTEIESDVNTISDSKVPAVISEKKDI